MTFVSPDAYLDHLRPHPAFAGAWNGYIESSYTYDLVWRAHRSSIRACRGSRPRGLRQLASVGRRRRRTGSAQAAGALVRAARGMLTRSATRLSRPSVLQAGPEPREWPTFSCRRQPLHGRPQRRGAAVASGGDGAHRVVTENVDQLNPNDRTRPCGHVWTPRCQDMGPMPGEVMLRWVFLDKPTSVVGTAHQNRDWRGHDRGREVWSFCAHRC